MNNSTYVLRFEYIDPPADCDPGDEVIILEVEAESKAEAYRKAVAILPFLGNGDWDLVANHP